MSKKSSLIISALFALCLVLSGCDADAFKKQLRNGNFLGTKKQKSKTSTPGEINKNSRLQQIRKGNSRKYHKASKEKKWKSSARKSQKKLRKETVAPPEPEIMFGFDEERERRKQLANRKKSKQKHKRFAR